MESVVIGRVPLVPFSLGNENLLASGASGTGIGSVMSRASVPKRSVGGTKRGRYSPTVPHLFTVGFETELTDAKSLLRLARPAPRRC